MPGKTKRGYRWVRNDGYILIHIPDHPNASKYGYVYEHVLAMSSAIGRPLAANEVVHHVNRNPSDNSIENLQLLTRVEHAKLHARERALAEGVDTSVERRCHACQEVKPLTEYSPTTSRGRVAISSKCKPCAAQWQRERRRRKAA